MRAGKFDSTSILQDPIGIVEGLTLSYLSATSIGIAIGRSAVGAAGSRSIAILASAFTKSLSSVWAAGTNQGMRASGAGAVAANQTWHIFIIRNTSTGAIDIQADTSATGANLTSGWSGRIIGSIMTDGSSNIRSFVQNGDRFDWTALIQDFYSTATPTSTTNLLTLTVPTGVAVVAFGRMGTSSTGNALNASNPAVAADAITYSPSAGYFIGRFEETTNATAQIKFYATNANSIGEVLTRGFYHPRGAY